MLDKLRALFGRDDGDIRDLIEAAEEIRRDLKDRTLLLADECVNDYLVFVRKWTRDIKEEYRAAVNEARRRSGPPIETAPGHTGNDADPRQWVYNYIIREAANRLASGELHIYRGVLGSEGGWLKQVFDQCLTNMVKIGAFTRAWATENWQIPVYQAIAEAG